MKNINERNNFVFEFRPDVYKRQKPGTFTFLGFTHYCSKSKNGRFRVKRKTSKKKFAKKCREINQLMGHMKTCLLYTSRCV